MKPILKFYLRYIHNRYGLTVIVFLVWMIFFDSNNLIDRINTMKELEKLETDIQYYKHRIETDSRNLNELRTNTVVLEKFAREQYFMKTDDEDIFIIVKE
ncbi:MAG: septum formation initiator family protein [Salinivirgaceae bacterium]|nr:septum formation initiator family protein [Salinivirgaceae bacterium]MDY0281833.1 septum formation initiator family protein [Salinivirgaceae bacterium]